jgi:hypothetical protein
MNRRFASITSGLLVRKGEARPWQMPGTEGATEFTPLPENIVPVKSEHRFTEEEIQSAADYQEWKRARDAEMAMHDRKSAPVRREHQPLPLHSDGDEHSKRLALRLTPAEYERLGIIGVKRDMTRQQLLRHAIDCYLAAAKAEYQSSCGCLSGEDCRADC